jgi:hypothetical protein
VEKESAFHIMKDLYTFRSYLASFVRRIISPSVACLALPYFSTLSLKRHDFSKKKND